MVDDLEKVRQGARAAWGAGDFTRFAEMLQESAGALVERLGIGPGDEVLDVGCGTGNLTLQAARTGAAVTGVDIAPPMLEAARRSAAAAGVDVVLVEGDAEDLPAASGSVDVVMSSFGCMFAPRHAVVARELARVLRPGGRMGLLTWPVDCTVADFLRMSSPHLPPRPAIAEPPLMWGDEDHVRELFEGTGIALTFATGTIPFGFASVEEALTVYTVEFGPIAAVRPMLESQGRWPALVDDFTAFFEARSTGPGGAVEMPSGYLVVLGSAPG